MEFNIVFYIMILVAYIVTALTVILMTFSGLVLEKDFKEGIRRIYL